MCHARKERVLLFGTRPADHIRASSHSGCTQRPDTLLHPNASWKRQIPLASRAPSIHGTKRHFAAAQQTVALGVKADMGGDATGRLSTIGLQALDTELGEDKNRKDTTWCRA